MPTQLPQDLVEEVIDHLAVDHGSLKTCSLISRAWVSRSRSYLFATCILTPKNIRSFCDLLQSSTFLSHVRTINASTHFWTQRDRHFNQFAADLRRLTGVRALNVTLSFLTAAASADAAFCIGFAKAFPAITKLDITCDCEGYLSEAQSPPLLDLISLFPTLQELSVEAVVHFQMINVPPTVVPPPGLRKVSLGTRVAKPILGWLHVTKHLPNLEVITLPYIQWYEGSMMREQLLQLTGIHTLNISISLSLGAPTSVLDLSLPPNLTTLDVTAIFPMQAELHRLISLLSTLPTPALIEHFSLALHPSWEKALDWELLDDFLSTPQFPRLRSVVLTGPKSSDKMLPLLAARGVLPV
ncbi:hypothetical protein B0H16DRAFT_1519221 [Mycena metata]|uniref:F-box domain-containing protein n=1 Tax=Mycena metata TaxID=1033252 RepID=A0AAD7JQ55_9AGAR|nr:hypothetical protein B0H16DRAFT_1519221 [Mycena metata]